MRGTFPFQTKMQKREPRLFLHPEGKRDINPRQSNEYPDTREERAYAVF